MMSLTLEKVVRIANVQICTLGNYTVYFKKSDSDYWQQYAPYHNRLAFASDEDKPVILYANTFIESEALTIKVKRLGFKKYAIE